MTEPDQIARHLLDQRAAAHAVNLADWKASGIQIADVEAAYAVQASMQRILEGERGQRTIGYKIGATNALARELLGVASPFYGRLYDETTTTDPKLSFKPGMHQVVEPEIALQLAADLGPAGAPYNAKSVRAAVGAALPVIEVVATCFDPWIEAGAPALIADNGVHGSWVMGAPKPAFQHIDLDELEVSVTAERAGAFTGRGSAVDGGPFGALAWLANALAAEGIGLKAGEYVSTGTTTPPVPLIAGDRIEADFDRLGTVTLEVSG